MDHVDILKTFFFPNFVLTFVIGIGAFVSYLLLRKHRRRNHELGKFPGPKWYPIVGSIVPFLFLPQTEVISMFAKWIDQYGTIISGWVGHFKPFVLVTDPNIIEKIISYNNLNKANITHLLHDWLGTGLITASREKWAVNRKLLTPSFHFKILEDFVPIFNAQSSIFLTCLEKEADNNKKFNIYPYITNMTLDIICETAMGVQINAQTSLENKDYIEATNGICQVILQKVAQPWLRIPAIYYFSSLYKIEKQYLNTLKGFTEEVVKARKLERKEQRMTNECRSESESNVGNNNTSLYGKQKKAFLDLMLDASENRNLLTDDDIRDEVNTFMFAGYDTSAVNVGYSILLLASNIECQKRLYAEIYEVFADDLERDITIADVSKMKYLDCCLKETLRLYPSAPYILRRIDYDISLDDGKIIPEGTTALIGIYHVHHSETHFPEPEKFKPERFLKETKHPYSYIPFSAGKRNCIGQKFAMLETKIILTNLLRKYRFEAGVRNLSEVGMIPGIVLRPENEKIDVIMYKRKS